jgi:hypothetical protein
MGTPDNNVTTIVHTERTDTTSPGPVQVIQQPDKGWVSNVIDSITNATQKIGILNLISLILVFCLSYSVWTLIPPLTRYLEEQGKASFEQTGLLRETKDVMIDIKHENAKRNELQEKGLKIQETQASAIGEFQHSQQVALENHGKVLDALALSNSTSATILSNQHEIIGILSRLQMSTSGNHP